jgi:hypothetical protein
MRSVRLLPPATSAATSATVKGRLRMKIATIKAVLERMRRVTMIMEMDANTAISRDRAREIATLIEILEREVERDSRTD